MAQRANPLKSLVASSAVLRESVRRLPATRDCEDTLCSAGAMARVLMSSRFPQMWVVILQNPCFGELGGKPQNLKLPTKSSAIPGTSAQAPRWSSRACRLSSAFEPAYAEHRSGLAHQAEVTVF